MNLIIKESTFDKNRIRLKEGKKVIKILYYIDCISIIGLSLKIRSFTYTENYDFLFLNIKESPQLVLLQLIDTHFQGIFKDYQTFINNYIIRIKKHTNYSPIDINEICITLNSLKKVNHSYKVQIITI